MAEVFALLREAAPPLFARRKGGQWQVDERRPDGGARGRKICVLVPGTHVLGLEITIPARSEAEARRAAPFAVEDEVAETVEAIHVALGPKPDSPTEARRTHVTSRQQMDEWIDQLAQLGLQEASLVASHSLVPPGNHLIEADNVVFGRLGARTFALEAATGSDVFQGFLNGDEGVAIYGAELAAAMRLQPAGPGIVDDKALLVQLAEWAEESDLIDLRQGPFRVSGSIDLKGIGQWRRAGILTGLVAASWFASVLMQTQAMQARTEELDRIAVEFTQAGWPQSGNDPQRALATLGADRRGEVSVFPPALAAIAILYDGLAAVPGSELRSVRYDRARGQVSAIIAFDGFSGADALTRAIELSGLSVRAGDARQSGAKVIGELTLEARR